MTTMGGDLAGRTFGNWQLLRPLGEGAFGAVYEAQNTSIAGRRAAVKVLHAHLAMNHEMKQRFLNEASAASRAEHENIVQIFDGGITPEGTCYSVMELLKGQTLAGLIQKGRLDIPRTLNIGSQVASALQAAHQLNIVHRDLKPDNIFVTQRSTNSEFVKVLDFGVAKLQGEAEATTTRVGMLIGTPAYMSPEQWMSLPDIDGRSDIYALGIILYECLTGRLPYDAQNAYGWQLAHLQQPLPELVGVPGEVSQLLQQLTAKRRDDRPQTMVEVAHALTLVRANVMGRKSSQIDATVSAEVPDAVKQLRALAATAAPSWPVPPSTTPVAPARGSTGNHAPPPLGPAAMQHSHGPGGTLLSARGSDGVGELRPQAPPRGSASVVIGVGALVTTAVAGLVVWKLTRPPAAPPAVQQPVAATQQSPVLPKIPEELVVLGPGTFSLGWGKGPHPDAPAHDVSVERFAIGKYEVSMGDYKKFAEATHVTADLPWEGVDDFDAIRDLPVNSVRQEDAARYCAWRYATQGGRLPTETEWEYAARDGQAERRYPWLGPHYDAAKVNAAPRGKRPELVAVDAMPAGATDRGLQHMIGNVAEWTSSPAQAYPGGAATVPPGSVVVRGGAANSTSPDELSATARRFVAPDTRDPFIGFRCATAVAAQ